MHTYVFVVVQLLFLSNWNLPKYPLTVDCINIVQLHIGILQQWRECSTVGHNNMNEFHKHEIEQMKSVTKDFKVLKRS